VKGQIRGIPRRSRCSRGRLRTHDLDRAALMADKRNSVAGKVATPNLKVGGGSNKDVIDADSNLYKAVGSRWVASLV
jgi:hypothetical protein